jgi:phosphoglycolate phosphatase
MTPRFRLVHVDLDGTLLDTRHDLAASTNAVRESFGLAPLEPEAVFELVGRGARVLVERALGVERRELHDEGVRRFLAHYGEHCLDATVPYPGLVDAIDRLRGDGVRFSIVTNKPEILSRRILEGLDLAGRFVAIVGGDTFPERKPDPSGIEWIRARELVDRQATLLVGDSPIDVETARAGGISSCGVLWGLDPQGLRRSVPDHLVRDGDELERVIRSGAVG